MPKAYAVVPFANNRSKTQSKQTLFSITSIGIPHIFFFILNNFEQAVEIGVYKVTVSSIASTLLEGVFLL